MKNVRAICSLPQCEGFEAQAFEAVKLAKNIRKIEPFDRALLEETMTVSNSDLINRDFYPVCGWSYDDLSKWAIKVYTFSGQKFLLPLN